MSGIYRVERDPDAPDWAKQWQVTWRRTDRSHVLVLVGKGELAHVLTCLAADANAREGLT